VTLSCHGIGISASREVAIGSAYLLRRQLPEVRKRQIEAHQIELEIARFQDALQTARDKFHSIRKQIPADTAKDILSFIDTHLLMLEDSAISQAPIELIQNQLYSAEWALQVRRDELISIFENMEDPYLKTRQDDVEHVVGQVQLALSGIPEERETDLQGRVVVARDLTPADTILMKHQGVAAFVTEFGGPLSHTAILARSLGIPAVVGAHQATQILLQGETLVVDGANGVVLANPTEAMLVHYRERIRARELREAELKRHINLPAFTHDGERISLFANIELPEDIPTTLENRADGVGLFRTEYLFMNRQTPPTEEEQLESYLAAVEGLQGIPITIRTLDLGADKTVSGGCIPAVNPALGLRAIRLCLKEPNLFLPQLRAILRASAKGPVRLMIPMLSSLQELRDTLRLVEQTKQALQQEGLDFDPQIPVGGMIEIPAAAISAVAFARQLDFLSIGTNDLIQYTLAVDRMDEEVNFLFDPLHPAVLHLIRTTIEAAAEANIPVGMCGEMAGDPRYTQLLLGMGLRELSMQPSALLEARDIIRHCNLKDLGQRTRQFLSRMHEEEEIMPLFQELFSPPAPTPPPADDR
jgi:phosphotransferase system enzyme I (PtsI)